MYIWKVEPLVEDLKNNNVTQSEQFKYLLVIIILTTLASDPILYIGSSYSQNDSIATILMLAVSIWGLWLLGRANTDGKDLVLRFCTLGLPVGVRFMAWFLPECLVIGGVEGYFGYGMTLDDSGSDIYATTIYSAVFMSMAIGIYYWRLAVALSKVCATNA